MYLFPTCMIQVLSISSVLIYITLVLGEKFIAYSWKPSVYVTDTAWSTF